jgi:hypothetical protein
MEMIETLEFQCIHQRELELVYHPDKYKQYTEPILELCQRVGATHYCAAFNRLASPNKKAQLLGCVFCAVGCPQRCMLSVTRI